MGSACGAPGITRFGRRIVNSLENVKSQWSGIFNRS
jgi:hypothetical protein